MKRFSVIKFIAVCLSIVTVIFFLQFISKFHRGHRYMNAKTAYQSSGTNCIEKKTVVTSNDAPISHNTLVGRTFMRGTLRSAEIPFRRGNNSRSTKSNKSVKNEWDLKEKEPFRSRRLHVIKLCENRNQKPRNILTERIKYSDHAKLIMCETPKTASSTWQTLFLKLDGYKRKITNLDLKRWAFRHFPIPSFRSETMTEQIALKRAGSYTSFVISRHPLARLVSAYYDKFSNKSRYSMFKRQYGRKIAFEQAKHHMHGIKRGFTYLKRYAAVKIRINDIIFSNAYLNLSFAQKRDVVEYLIEMKTGQLTFSHFIDHIIFESEKQKEKNTHWDIQVDMCKLCLMNYTFFAKFENLTKESERLLEYFQRHNKPRMYLPDLHFPKKPSSYITERVIRNTWMQIPEEKVEKIRNIYKDDFLFYNYDPYTYRGYRNTSF